MIWSLQLSHSSIGQHPTAGVAAEVVMQDPSLPARKMSFPLLAQDSPSPTPFPKLRNLPPSSTRRSSTVNLGRKGKEHSNPPADRLLPCNRGCTGRSTQVLQKTKTQWCQSTQSMAQDNYQTLQQCWSYVI